MPNFARVGLTATTTSNLKNIGANQQIKINTRTRVEIKGNFITSIGNNCPTKRCRFVVTLLQSPNSSPVSWIQSRRRLVSKHSLSQSVEIRAVAGNSTMANSVRVAVVQMTSVNDIAANFATCSRLVKVPFDFRLFRCYMFFMPVFGW